MRANGYKCYQTKCGVCEGNVCREPFDIALGCDARLVKPQTNADRIRAMSDEELAVLLLDGCRGSECGEQLQNEYGSVDCFSCRLDWLQLPVKDGEGE